MTLGPHAFRRASAGTVPPPCSAQNFSASRGSFLRIGLASDTAVLAKLKRLTGLTITPVIAPEDAIAQAIDKYYSRS